MAISHGRSCIAVTLVLALLGGSAAAKTTVSTLGDGASRPIDAWVDSTALATDDPPAAGDGSVLAISAGALAGAIVGIVLTSGLATPVGAAAMVSPGVAFAAREGAIYAARTVAVMISATIGGLLGNWIYQRR